MTEYGLTAEMRRAWTESQVELHAENLARSIDPSANDEGVEVLKRAILEDCGDSRFQYVLRLADAVRAHQALQSKDYR
jgi:hypothetical protein